MREKPNGIQIVSKDEFNNYKFPKSKCRGSARERGISGIIIPIVPISSTFGFGRTRT